MELALHTFDRQLGIRPTGYRSPYWDYSDATWNWSRSSASTTTRASWRATSCPTGPAGRCTGSGNVPGKASHVLEIPVNWYLDDFPPLAHVTGIQAGMQDTDTIYRRWRDIFDYGYERVESPCYAVAVQPQIIGQAHHTMWFERLVVLHRLQGRRLVCHLRRDRQRLGGRRRGPPPDGAGRRARRAERPGRVRVRLGRHTAMTPRGRGFEEPRRAGPATRLRRGTRGPALPRGCCRRAPRCSRPCTRRGRRA
jgi:hypothetical protein